MLGHVISPSLKHIIPGKGCQLLNTTPDARHGTLTWEFEHDMSYRAIAGKSSQPQPARPTTPRDACRTPSATLQVDCPDAAVW
jgi:hypothetical protein